MPRITIELIRKRVEHNEGEIHSVEELALHQQKIEKLENLDRWCRKLKILLLHNNLIAKIENVSRLKELEYLNLSLNNIERIENLEGCESLKKLDLTLNFIGEITSVVSLQSNPMLENLYLTGNPCTDFPGYRTYVINLLPQLKTLDGTDITPTEKIVARQEFSGIEPEILRTQTAYGAKRELEKESYVEDLGNGDDKGEIDEAYWNKVTPNTPEIRREMTLRSMKLEEKSQDAKGSLKPKRDEEGKSTDLFFSDGRPKSMNQPKISFSLHDDQHRQVLILDLAIPRFMDSSLIDADVQPTHAKFVIKGKIFQIVLPEEVKPDSSTAQRSKTTGHLVVTMPKLHQIRKPRYKEMTLEDDPDEDYVLDNAVSAKEPPKVQEEPSNAPVDWRNIVLEDGPDSAGTKRAKNNSDTTLKSDDGNQEQIEEDNFQDNPDVPPLL